MGVLFKIWSWFIFKAGMTRLERFRRSRGGIYLNCKNMKENLHGWLWMIFRKDQFHLIFFNISGGGMKRLERFRKIHGGITLNSKNMKEIYIISGVYYKWYLWKAEIHFMFFFFFFFFFQAGMKKLERFRKSRGGICLRWFRNMLLIQTLTANLL